MSMGRNIITIGESGDIITPNNITDIWMSEPELVELLGITAPALRAAVRAIYKSGALKEYEVQKYVRLENGYNADVFSLSMIVALAFRINGFGAEQMRNVILERFTCEKRKQSSFRW